MIKIKAAISAFLLLSVYLSSIPSIAISEPDKRNAPPIAENFGASYFNIDPGMLLPGNPDIDPGMLLHVNPDIDPGMLIRP